jgi:uncharacterized protein (TIGR02266 family)
MTQDTRKDRRVKIVSLNVRYKSATIDEFIENHAHDVSRGGIYIKTANPFPVGTLLKFEIRLVADQPVITGVGRVVWKRDTPQDSADQPAGMGVKFIKVDDASRVIIDRLASSRADAGKAFESETASGSGRSSLPPDSARGNTKVASAPPMRRKATPYPGVAAVVSTPAGSRPSGPVFPRSVPPDAASGTKPEPTVMRQAAELLEEALREAGGSMEEVGSNPLFGAPGVVAKANPPLVDRPSVPVAATESAANPVSKGPAIAAELVPAFSAVPVPTAKRVESHASTRSPQASARRPRSHAPLIIAGGVVVVGGLIALNRDRLFGSDAPQTSPLPAATSAISPAPPLPPAESIAALSKESPVASSSADAAVSVASAKAEAAPSAVVAAQPRPKPEPIAPRPIRPAKVVVEAAPVMPESPPRVAPTETGPAPTTASPLPTTASPSVPPSTSVPRVSPPPPPAPKKTIDDNPY